MGKGSKFKRRGPEGGGEEERDERGKRGEGGEEERAKEGEGGEEERGRERRRE